MDELDEEIIYTDEELVEEACERTHAGDLATAADYEANRRRNSSKRTGVLPRLP